MRTRKKKWTARELAENPRVLREPEAYAGRISQYFGNNKPIHVEIGCGKGRFITQTALRNPEVNHVAIERDPTILAAAARLSSGIDGSLVFLLADATDISTLFATGEVERLYINFCDPWPSKKKWAKRRLTHVNFLAMYERLGIPAIFFKTDNRLLFEFSLNQFSERGWKLRNISLDLHKSEDGSNIKTEYEEKFSALGFPIYRLEAYRN